MSDNLACKITGSELEIMKQDPDFPACIKRRRPAGKAKRLLLLPDHLGERIQRVGYGRSDHSPL